MAGLSCGDAGGGFSVMETLLAAACSDAAAWTATTFFLRLLGMPTPSFGPMSALCTLRHFVCWELGAGCWTMHWEGLDGS